MVDPAKLRAWYAHRQGLDGTLDNKSAAEVLAGAGWARSVGGVSPYLALFARAGISREQADTAARDLEIHELPSARGCTYVLPAADFPLGLASGRPFQGEMKVAMKLGVTEKEINKLCDSILAALNKGPLDPDGLRKACGKAVRNLGEQGKKKGLSTTLPVALERLQTSGHIRRVPTNGRLDQQRYLYALWKPNPLTGFELSPEQVQTELARAYFSWIGPASLAQFQTFSGLGLRAAQAAIQPLKLLPVEVAPGDNRLLLPQYRDEFEAFRIPKEPKYALLGSIDPLFLGGYKDFSDTELENHAILDRGRLIGLWDYDPATESIVWTSFVHRDRALQEAVTRTEEFVRHQLGDARSFGLDSPKTRAPRIAALRKAAAGA